MKDGNVGSTFIKLGNCLMNMQQYDHALTDFNYGQSIYEALISTDQNPCDSANVRDFIKQCDKAILSAKF